MGATDWRGRRELTALIEYLREQVDAKQAPHLVFVTGDLANRGKSEELQQAAAFLREVMAALGLTPEAHLFVVPGNHDVDRDAVARMDRLVVRDLLDTKDAGEVDAVLGNDDELEQLSCLSWQLSSCQLRQLSPQLGELAAGS